MKILIVADVHANLVALNAVLHDAQSVGFDVGWNLGDTVGYGPRPSACIEQLATFNFQHSLLGNHDAAAVGLIDTDNFNALAREAAEWTSRQLDQEDVRHLKSLPTQLVDDQNRLVHGSPRSPLWEYITDAEIAFDNFQVFPERRCFVGHHHFASVTQLLPNKRKARMHHVKHGESIDLTEGRFIVNPGSVGQPRDGDPRASWALLDIKHLRIVFFRTPYDVPETQRQMRCAGLPEPLSRRLEFGV